MPSKSKKQHNLMEMVAHNPKKAKELGIAQSVGKDFVAADKGKRFGTGGSPTITRGGKGMINRQATRFGSVLGEEKNVPNVNLNKYIGKKEGGSVKHDDIKEDKKLIKRAFGMHDKQEHGGKHTDLSKLKKGGMAMDKESRMSSKGEHAVQKKSKRGAEVIKMAKGGLASGHKSADGIASKGKTKARSITMCGGGMTKKK
jgi:hypothetical protein